MQRRSNDIALGDGDNAGHAVDRRCHVHGSQADLSGTRTTRLIPCAHHCPLTSQTCIITRYYRLPSILLGLDLLGHHALELLLGGLGVSANDGALDVDLGEEVDRRGVVE